MGRRILSQRAGKGTQNFRSPKHKKRGEVKYPPLSDKIIEGTIIDFVHEGGRGTPLALVSFENGKRQFMLPPEGVFLGDKVQIGPKTEIEIGNTMALINIPEGSLVYNIELRPGDGGKIVRASGTTATVVTRSDKGVVLMLPSGTRKTFHQMSRATIGVVAGGGKINKPFVKAGAKYFYVRTKATIWPKLIGSAMNANSHPFGGGRKKRAGKSTTTSRNAPPGRKVGLIAARRSGLKKR